MQNYYFTFGSDTRRANKYVRVTATDYDAARKLMMEVYDRKWAFQYDEEAFACQPYEFGLSELEHLKEVG